MRLIFQIKHVRAYRDATSFAELFRDRLAGLVRELQAEQRSDLFYLVLPRLEDNHSF